MPLLATKYFGAVSFDPADAYRFPQGLPAFELEKSFVLLDVASKRPLVFLQSAGSPDLCFLALPISVIDPEYELSISFEDLSLLELDTNRQPIIGTEVLVLALIAIQEGRAPQANLMAPLVINPQNRIGLQAIRSDSRYSFEHPVTSRSKQEELC
jgi:flagellar assembly factor FliW